LNQLIAAAKNDFHSIFKKCWKKVQTNSQKYEKDDVRMDYFNAFSTLNLWLLINLDNFEQLLNPEDKKIA